MVKITEYIPSTNGLYGAGRSKTEAWWKAFGKLLFPAFFVFQPNDDRFDELLAIQAQQLTNENYLDSKMVQGGFGSTVALSPKARKFMADKTDSSPVLLFETKELRELSVPVVKPTYSITISTPQSKSSKPPANM